MNDAQQAILDQLKSLQGTAIAISWQLGILLAVVVVSAWRFW